MEDIQVLNIIMCREMWIYWLLVKIFIHISSRSFLIYIRGYVIHTTHTPTSLWTRPAVINRAEHITVRLHIHSQVRYVGVTLWLLIKIPVTLQESLTHWKVITGRQKEEVLEGVVGNVDTARDFNNVTCPQ